MPDAIPYTAYRQILRSLGHESARLFLLACDAWRSSQDRTEDLAPTFDVARTVSMLTTITRRAHLIAQYVETLPVLDEERRGQVENRLDLVFAVFAKHKIDLATYYAWVDADMQRELETEMEVDYLEDGLDEKEPELDTDIIGRRPMALVGELCCDFGIATHSLPAEWLAPTPPELRLLCARAAASYIRPARPAAKSVRLRAHSHPRS